MRFEGDITIYERVAEWKAGECHGPLIAHKLKAAPENAKLVLWGARRGDVQYGSEPDYHREVCRALRHVIKLRMGAVHAAFGHLARTMAPIIADATRTFSKALAGLEVSDHHRAARR